MIERGQSAVGSRQSDIGDPTLAQSSIASYRDLRVWKMAIELAVDCYRSTQRFPQSEVYGLTSQIRRSATSIAANIAEGYGRDSRGGYLQFLRISQGSLKDLETHLIISARLELLDADAEADLLRKSEDIGKMLRALIRSIEKAN
jgi:four helix bundle protein